MQLTDTHVTVLLLGAVVLVLLVFVGAMAARERARSRKAAELANALGFIPSDASAAGAHHHWVSPPGTRPTLMGYYPGSREVSGTAGLMLMLHTGTFIGARRGLDLAARPPRLTGSGESSPWLEAALSPAVVEASSGLPHALLAPGEGLLPGALLHEIVAAAWPGGWRGLHLRVVLPTRSGPDEVRAALAQMERVADALVHADRGLE